MNIQQRRQGTTCCLDWEGTEFLWDFKATSKWEGTCSKSYQCRIYFKTANLVCDNDEKKERSKNSGSFEAADNVHETTHAYYIANPTLRPKIWKRLEAWKGWTILCRPNVPIDEALEFREWYNRFFIEPKEKFIN